MANPFKSIDPLLFTTGQVAKMLACDADTVRKLQASGRLRGVKLLSREWRYSREEVERFVREETAGTNKPQEQEEASRA